MFYSDNGDIHTYLDHFLLCSRNPTNPKAQTAMGQSCMSKGGIPVQPYFVLGGFNGSSYNGKYKIQFLEIGFSSIIFREPKHISRGNEITIF